MLPLQQQRTARLHAASSNACSSRRCYGPFPASALHVATTCAQMPSAPVWRHTDRAFWKRYAKSASATQRTKSTELCSRECCRRLAGAHEIMRKKQKKKSRHDKNKSIRVTVNTARKRYADGGGFFFFFFFRFRARSFLTSFHD